MVVRLFLYARLPLLRGLVLSTAQRPVNCAEAITMGYGNLGQQRVDISPQLTDICVSCVKDRRVSPYVFSHDVILCG